MIENANYIPSTFGTQNHGWHIACVNGFLASSFDFIDFWYLLKQRNPIFSAFNLILTMKTLRMCCFTVNVIVQFSFYSTGYWHINIYVCINCQQQKLARFNASARMLNVIVMLILHVHKCTLKLYQWRSWSSNAYICYMYKCIVSIYIFMFLSLCSSQILVWNRFIWSNVIRSFLYVSFGMLFVRFPHLTITSVPYSIEFSYALSRTQTISEQHIKEKMYNNQVPLRKVSVSASISGCINIGSLHWNILYIYSRIARSAQPSQWIEMVMLHEPFPLNRCARLRGEKASACLYAITLLIFSISCC